MWCSWSAVVLSLFTSRSLIKIKQHPTKKCFHCAQGVLSLFISRSQTTSNSQIQQHKYTNTGMSLFISNSSKSASAFCIIRFHSALEDMSLFIFESYQTTSRLPGMLSLHKYKTNIAPNRVIHFYG